ncbi:MAG TPA: sialidase family protein [Streptosporangiaceae bacterium]|nr:sialidase family protein [Streptosporangiaceae bacterium]
MRARTPPGTRARPGRLSWAFLAALTVMAVVSSCTSSARPPHDLGQGSPQPTPSSQPALAGTPVTEVSRGCAGQNVEAEAAAGAPDYVYVVWIGCSAKLHSAAIGFARSSDGGKHFSTPIVVPGSPGGSWDPSVTVAPDGTVYVAYMRIRDSHAEPVVAASFDHGATFPQVTADTPPVSNNWGDRDFIAAGPADHLYLTWDYGPSVKLMKFLCSRGGSCSFSAGDVNSVMQVSTDGGKTWGPITPMGPDFPRNGGIGAPVLTQPGRIDVLYCGHAVSQGTFVIHPGHEFFTSSANGTAWPAHPLELWPGQGPIVVSEWWIDVDLGADAGGTLYATWDTQTAAGDIGWLTWSSDGGRVWSRPVRVTPDHDHAVHIVQVAGGAAGTAYVGWQTDAAAQGYATYLRPFSTAKGWLGPAVRVSPGYGNAKTWPGDTFGLTALPGRSTPTVFMSWGSAAGTAKDSEIYATTLPQPH